MDTDRLNRWLTLIANLAVVAGIIFLGLKLRQDNELLQFEAGSIYFQNRVWGINKTLDNPEFAQKCVVVGRYRPSRTVAAENYHD